MERRETETGDAATSPASLAYKIPVYRYLLTPKPDKCMKHFAGMLMPPHSLYEKIVRIMRLTALFMIIGILQIHAHGYSQGTLLSLNRPSAPLGSVLKEIERKSDFSIFYRNDQLDLNRKITISVRNASLDSVLRQVLRGQPLSFKIIGHVIVIKPSADPSAESLSSPSPESLEITGKVVNDKTGEGIAGVSVMEKNTTNGVVTDANGVFRLRVRDGSATLVFHYVGFREQEWPVNNRTSCTISLQQETRLLDQVVVVGYGTQKKKDITGSVSVISSKELEDRPNNQFGYALEGKAAGVQVIRSSGQPQAGFSIRIRGTSTITSGSEPLYIVDGVPTASINEINPADIESFSVLKDASAAAIYGSSGANGVILITTRRGRNQKAAVNLEVYNGYSSIWRRMKVLNSSQYKDLMAEMGQPLDGSKYTANTNWQDELFRKANQQNYQLSVTGGNQQTGFYLSGSVMKQDGVVITNTVNRANFKLNLDHTISKIFKVGTSISYNRWHDVDVSENSRNGSIMNTILGAPVIGIWDSTGKEYTTDPFRNDLDNPVALATGTLHGWTNLRFQGNAYLEAQILPSLKFRSMFGYEEYHGIYNLYVDPYKTTSGRGFKGQAEQSASDNQYWISENTLTFHQSFGQHNLTALAGFITSKTESGASDIRTHNFANPDITTVNGGSVIDGATATAAAVSTASVISRIGYDYADRYLFTANFRADASSVFGPAKRWGYFPSFSAGWRISKEAFFEGIDGINDLKLRGSWGAVGNNQIAPYSYLGTVAPSGSYVIGGNVVAGYLPQSLDNPSLHWETTHQTDIGLDLALFNSRVLFTADYYYKKTTGLLLNTPVPASSGYTTALKNIGDLENKGWEFQLTTRNLTGAFQWSSDFNISFNRNKVLNIAGGTIHDGPLIERGNSSIVRAGLPLGSFFGYVAQGVDPATGNMNYRIKDQSQGLATSDMTVIGNANPSFAYGFTNNFKYGSWSLNVFLQGVYGNDIFNATRIFSEGLWEPRNQSAVVLRRWEKPGDHTDIPRQDLTNTTTPVTYYNSLISSRFVEKGSYLRVKSLSLSYELPGTLLQKWSITRARLYVTGENLLTFTHYSGFDPEVSAFGKASAGSQSNNVAPGIDFGTYPQTRDIIVGLNITF